VWPVLGLDHAAEAFAGGGEVVFEFADASLREVGFGGVGITFGE
jgi:hypothetical protein